MFVEWMNGWVEGWMTKCSYHFAPVGQLHYGNFDFRIWASSCPHERVCSHGGDRGFPEIIKKGRKSGKGLIFLNNKLPPANHQSINAGSEEPEGSWSNRVTRWSEQQSGQQMGRGAGKLSGHLTWSEFPVHGGASGQPSSCESRGPATQPRSLLPRCGPWTLRSRD